MLAPVGETSASPSLSTPIIRESAHRLCNCDIIAPRRYSVCDGKIESMMEYAGWWRRGKVRTPLVSASGVGRGGGGGRSPDVVKQNAIKLRHGGARQNSVWTLCVERENLGMCARPGAAATRRASFPALYAGFYTALSFSSPRAAARNYALGLISRSRKRVPVSFLFRLFCRRTCIARRRVTRTGQVVMPPGDTLGAGWQKIESDTTWPAKLLVAGAMTSRDISRGETRSVRPPGARVCVYVCMYVCLCTELCIGAFAFTTREFRRRQISSASLDVVNYSSGSRVCSFHTFSWCIGHVCGTRGTRGRVVRERFKARFKSIGARRCARGRAKDAALQ